MSEITRLGPVLRVEWRWDNWLVGVRREAREMRTPVVLGYRNFELHLGLLVVTLGWIWTSAELAK